MRSDLLSLRPLYITGPLWATYKKPTAQIGAFGFADIPIAIGTNAEKPKEMFLANARTENETEKVNLETE